MIVIECPKCKADVDHLEMVQTGTQRANLYVNKKEITPAEKAELFRELKTVPIEYSDVEFEGNGEVLDYRCPFCNETLFDSEDEAAEFLGAIKPKETEAIL